MKERIFDTVKALEGPRDGVYSFDALEKSAVFIEDAFRDIGFAVSSDSFSFSGKPYRNIIAGSAEAVSKQETVLICAHYDAVAGSPGADDNASGVAVMLEAARQLGPREGLRFAAFSLEEPQMTGANFLYGSRHFVAGAKKRGERYRAVFNLESVGYVNSMPGSQQVPPLVNGPTTGDFIALVGNRKAAPLMKLFEDAAGEVEPSLTVFSHRALMKGYLLPPTRLSDHAPFWDAGYPAVMITDTAMMRNPNYHTRNDTSETLSPEFMEQVCRILIHTVEKLLGC